jgi:hypothetical protein
MSWRVGVTFKPLVILAMPSASTCMSLMKFIKTINVQNTAQQLGEMDTKAAIIVQEVIIRGDQL